MNLRNSPMFQRYKVLANTIGIDSVYIDGRWQEIPVTTGTVEGFKFTKSDASRFYSQSFNEDVSAVLICWDIGDLEKNSKITINGVEYCVDSIDNTIEAGEVFLVGIKAVK